MQLHSFTFIEVHVLESKTYKKTLLASREKAQTMVVWQDLNLQAPVG